jgi:hypothetical protein
MGTPTSFAVGCAILLSASGCEREAAPEVRPEAVKVEAVKTEAAKVEAAKVEADPASIRRAELEPVNGTVPAPSVQPSGPVDLASSAAKPQGGAPSLAASSAKAAAAPEGSKREPTQGTVVNDEAFSAWLQAETPAAAATATHVEAILVAKAPYHCNAEYPHKFKLNAAPPGVSYPEETVRGMQVSPERGVLRIPIQTHTPGLAKVSGTLSFSVCTDERCLVEKRDLSLDVDVR